MKWITGFMAGGLASFVLFGCMSGTSFEAKPSPAAVAAPAPVAPVVLAPAAPVMVMPAPEVLLAPKVMDVYFPGAPNRPGQVLHPKQVQTLDPDEEDTGMFSRRAPIRHKQKTLKKDIN